MDEQPTPDAPDTVVIPGAAAEPANPSHAPAAGPVTPPTVSPLPPEAGVLSYETPTTPSAVAPASRRPTLLLVAALVLVAIWAIASTAGFAVERNAHNDDRTTLQAQVSDRDRRLAELQSQHNAMEAKLAETSKLALTPAQYKAVQACVADVRRTRGAAESTGLLGRAPAGATAPATPGHPDRGHHLHHGLRRARQGDAVAMRTLEAALAERGRTLSE
jgi:hypothetical protein